VVVVTKTSYKNTNKTKQRTMLLKAVE